MHQITVIEPKWLSEVAPTFFRVADLNKISKRKAAEKIEPLHDRFAADKDDWVRMEDHHQALADLTSASEQSQEAGLQFPGIYQWRWRPRLVVRMTFVVTCYVTHSHVHIHVIYLVSHEQWSDTIRLIHDRPLKLITVHA